MRSYNNEINRIIDFGSNLPFRLKWHSIFYKTCNEGLYELRDGLILSLSLILMSPFMFLTQLLFGSIIASTALYIMSIFGFIVLIKLQFRRLNLSLWVELHELHDVTEWSQYLEDIAEAGFHSFFYLQKPDLMMAVKRLHNLQSKGITEDKAFEYIFTIVLMSHRFGWDTDIKEVEGADKALFSGTTVLNSKRRENRRVEPYISGFR